MMELSLLLAAPIVKVVLDKFCEGVAYKLGDKAVEALPEKVKQLVKQLGQLVWVKCLRGKPGTEALLQKAADGSAVEQKQLTDYLHKVLDSDTDLQQEARKLAEEIRQVIQFEDVNARNVQQIFGGQGMQINERQDQPIVQIQGNPTLNFGKSD